MSGRAREEWRPAEPETMPLDGQEVLFVIRNEDGGHTHGMFVGSRGPYEDGGETTVWASDEYHFDDEEIIEWMPCPKPSSVN